MLFLPSKPIQVKITVDRKIIILSQKQIMFSHMDNFEDNLSFSLIGTDPKAFYYNGSLEVLVQTRNTLQIYFCDWKTEVKIIKVSILNGKKVNCVSYSSGSGWNILCDNSDDEPKINFKSLKATRIQKQNVNGRCYIENMEYILSSEKLYCKNHDQEIEGYEEIQWSEENKQKISGQLSAKVKMEGFGEKKHKICLNQRYILVIQNNEVSQVFERKKVKIFNSDIVVSQGKENIEKKLNQIENFNENLCGGKVFNNQLSYLEFKDKFIYLRNQPLREIYRLSSPPVILRKSHDSQDLSDLGQSFKIAKKYSEFQKPEEKAHIEDLLNQIPHISQNQSSQNTFILDHSGKLSNKSSGRKRVPKGKIKMSYKSQSSFSKLSQSQNIAQTPAFGFDQGNKWGNNDYWENNDFYGDQSSSSFKKGKKQVSVQMIIKQETEYENSPIHHSRKFQAFKPEGVVSQEIVERLEGQSYVKLMTEMWEKDERRFEQLLKEFAFEIIEDKDCFLFFAQFIKGETNKEISKIFSNIFQRQKQISEEEKSKITSALRQFKITQVPVEILSFSKDFLSILLILNLQIYIQNLLSPSIQIVTKLLQSYINQKQRFKKMVLQLEGEKINIENPRNFLNVLLYLNETLNLELEDVILVYCGKMIQNDYFPIIAKIKEQKILQICNIPDIALTKLLQSKFHELFIETKGASEKLWKLIAFFPQKKAQEYSVKLAIIQEFLKVNLLFAQQKILDFSPESSLQEFLKEVIQQNTVNKLSKFRLKNTFKGLYWLKNNVKISTITIEFVNLCKFLSQKFAKFDMFYESFKILSPVLKYIKKSFLAKLLYQYGNGKFLNRLTVENLTNLKEIFREIFQNPNISIKDFNEDQIVQKENSSFFTCNNSQFTNIFNLYFEGDQLRYLLFMDFDVGKQLFDQLSLEKREKFNQLSLFLNQYLLVEGSLSRKSSAFSSSYYSDNDELLLLEEGKLKNRRLLSEDHNDRSDLQRKKLVFSDVRLQSNYPNSNSSLFELKFIVNERQKRDTLKQIYHYQSKQKFLEAIKLLNFTGFKRIQKYKQLIYQGLEIDISKILPFEMFEIEQSSLILEIAEESIYDFLTIQNFWIVSCLIQFMLGQSQQIKKLMLKKIILRERSDQYADVVEDIFVSSKYFSNDQVKDLLKMAKMYNLEKIQTILRLYIDQ